MPSGVEAQAENQSPAASTVTMARILMVGANILEGGVRAPITNKEAQGLGDAAAAPAPGGARKVHTVVTSRSEALVHSAAEEDGPTC